MWQRQRWLIPAGLAVIALTVAATAGGGVGLGTTGRQLLVTTGLGCYVTAGTMFLMWRSAPRVIVVGLLLAMAAAATLVHHADPEGPVVGLYLPVAFAPLRLDLRAALPVAAASVAMFDVVVIATAPNPAVFAIVVTGGAAFFFLFGALLRSEQQQRLRADRLVVELEESREAERVSAALAERSRLAREMHDVLAHTLTGLAVQLDGARLLVPAECGDSPLSGAIVRAHALARDGLAEARQAISTLRGDALPGPELLPALVNEHRRSAAGECRLTVAGTPVPLGPDARLAMYRTAQEALNNVRKHAPGARVDVRLDWFPAEAVLVVADNGGTGGAGAEWLRGSGLGYGLTGMAERARLLGGRLDAGPSGDGFRVTLTVPVDTTP